MSMLLALPFIVFALILHIAIVAVVWTVWLLWKTRWWAFTLLFVAVLFLSGCAADTNTLAVGIPRQGIPVALRTCAPEPQAPDPGASTQRTVDKYDESVRAAGADCRRKMSAIVIMIEGRKHARDRRK